MTTLSFKYDKNIKRFICNEDKTIVLTRQQIDKMRRVYKTVK